MPKKPALKPSEVESIVNERMSSHPVLKRLGAQALPGTALHGEFGWSVIVGTEKKPPSTFRFISELVDVTEELLDDNDLDVILAPSGRRPSDPVK
jgi:hypothetical protein